MASATRAEDVRRRIVDAFGSARHPGEDNLVDDETALEPMAVAKALEGKTWREVNLSFLRAYGERGDSSAILSFLSPAAFRYFVPAFMLLLLDHYAEADVLADTAISKLAPWRDPADSALTKFFEVRHQSFDAQERSAVLAFLKFIKQEHGADYVQGDLDRAIRHWERLASRS